MATIAQGTVLKAVVELALIDNVIAQNIFHFIVAGFDSVEEEAVLDELRDWANAMYAEIEDYVSSAVSLDTILVHSVLWNEEEEQWLTDEYIGFRELTDAFADATDMMPHQVAATVTGITGDVRRQGRKFLAGLTEAAGGAGDLAAGPLADVGAWAVDYIADITIFGANYLNPGVAGGKSKAGIGDGEFHPFTGVTFSSIFGSQRRRKQGVGI